MYIIRACLDEFPPCHPSTLATAPPGATYRSDPPASNPQQTPIHHPAPCPSNDRPLNSLPPEVSTAATGTQRPESPAVTLTCRANKCKVHKLHQRYIDRNNSNEVKWCLTSTETTRLIRDPPQWHVYNYIASISGTLDSSRALWASVCFNLSSTSAASFIRSCCGRPGEGRATRWSDPPTSLQL